MQRIIVGRYKPTPGGPFVDLPSVIQDEDGTIVSTTDLSAHFDGWLEGVRDDGTSWIMWIDAIGNPMVYYANRDEDGGVEGDPIILSPGHPYFKED